VVDLSLVGHGEKKQKGEYAKALERFLRKCFGITEHYDPNSPSRKYEGVIGTSIEVTTLKNCVIYIDNSGSMSNKLEELVRQVSQLAEAWSRLTRIDFYVAHFDDGLLELHRVRGPRHLEKKTRVSMHYGGGTDITPAIEKVMRLVPRPDATLVLSDMVINAIAPSPGPVRSYVKRNLENWLWVYISVNSDYSNTMETHISPIDPAWARRLVVVK
jgi:hypothetical protein